MGFAEGWDPEESCLRQCTLPTPSGFVFEACAPPQKASERISQPPQEEFCSPTPSGPPLFLTPLLLENTLPSAGYPAPTYTPITQYLHPNLFQKGCLSLRGEMNVGPGHMGLRLGFEQTWKSHLTSLSLSTSSRRQNYGSLTCYLPYVGCDHPNVQTNTRALY